MNDCTPVQTPESHSTKLHLIAISEDNSQIKFPYLEVVGSILYLMISTRPDLAHAVRVLATYMQNYSHEHVTIAKRVLRYISGTREYGLFYTNKNSSAYPNFSSLNQSKLNSNNLSILSHIYETEEKSVAQQKNINKNNIMQVSGIAHALHKDSPVSPITNNIKVITTAMTDANYGGEPESLQGNSKLDYKSISGCLVFLGKNPVIWSSKKQNNIAQSSCQSELQAAVTVSNEIVWVNKFLSELYFTDNKPSMVYCDNQAAIASTESRYTGDRIKHIALRWHVIQDYVESKQIIVKYIETKSQLADILTKGTIKPEQFILLRDKLVGKLH